MQPNRLYLFISQINKMIVHTTDLETLYKEACRIAVEVGQFRMAWIGILDESTQKIFPVAHAGDDKDYPLIIPTVTIKDDPDGRGPSGTAIRQGKYLVCNDLENDPLLKPWRTEAIKRGYRSAISLPIIKFGKVMGVFSIYTSEVNFFDEVEISLLNDIATDVTFAIENIEKEQLRKNAELAILEKEKRYDTLTEISPVGIFRTDEFGFTTYVNPTWCKISGLSLNDALGNGWLNSVHPNDKGSILKGWNKAIESNELSLSEYRFVRQDGTIAWVIGQAIPEINLDGRLTGYVGTVTDITGRKLSEQEIIKANERFKDLLDNLEAGVVIHAPDTSIVASNAKATELLGLSEEQMNGKMAIDPQWRFIFEDGNTIPIEQYPVNLIVSTGQPIKNIISGVVRPTSNDLVWLSINGFPVHGSNGKLEEIVISFIDITGRKKVEIELTKAKDLAEEHSQRFRNYIENAPDGIFVADEKGNYLETNPAATYITGYSREELLSMSIKDLTPPDSLDYAYELFRTLLDTGISKGETTFIHKNGDARYWNIEAVKISEDRLLGFVKDITAIRIAADAKDRIRLENEALINNTNDLLWSISNDYSLIAANRAFLCDLEQNSGTLLKLGDNVLAIENISKEFRQYWKGLYDQALSGKKVLTEVFVPQAESKEELWFELMINPIIIAEKVNGIVCSMRNITERKKAAEEKEINRIRNEALINSTNDLMWSVGKDYRLITANTAFLVAMEENNGIKPMPGDLLLNPDYYTDLYLSYWRSYYDRALSGEQVNDKIVDANDLNDQATWFEISIHPIFDGLEISGVACFAKDITEGQNAADEIKKSNERFELIGQITKDGIWEWDLTTNIIWANEAHQQLYGLNREDAVPNFEEWKKRIHPDDRERMIKAFNVALDSDGDTFLSEYKFQTNSIGWINIFGRTYIERNTEGKPVRLIGNMTNITSIKQSEQQLKLLESVITNANDSVLITKAEPQGEEGPIIVYVNEAFTKMTGYKSEEVIGKTPRILQGKNSDKDQLRELGKAMKNWESAELTIINYKKNGEEFWNNFSISPLADQNGLFTHWIAIEKDVTERVNGEKRLKENEERLRLSLQAAQQGLFDINLQTGTAIVNDQYAQMLGYDPANFTESLSFWLERIHPGDLKETSNFFQSHLKGDSEVFEFEFRQKTKDNNWKWILSLGKIVEYDNDGKPLRMLGTQTDITERKKTEEALKLSEEQYRTLVEQASDGIFIADAHGKFINVNPSACNLSRYSEAELLQMTIFDFAVTEDLERHPFHFEALKKGQSVITERFMKGRDGVIRDIEVTAKQLSDGRLLAFIRDISARKNVEREIIKEKNLSDSIINSLPGIFYLFNKQGKYLRWNKNFETVTGYSKAEIYFLKPIDIIVDDEKNMVRDCISMAYKKGANSIQAFLLPKSKEKIPYYFKGVAIDYEGQSCIVGVGIDFSERVRVQQEIEETSVKLRELTAHLLDVREEERKRIGREIHDELGQQLTAIKMDVSWIDKQTKEDNALVKSKLKNIIHLLDESNQSIRRILNELRPYILDNYGLSEAIMWLGEQFTENTGVPVLCSTDEFEGKLPETVATCIFRIYQEALTNITRYAGAKEVRTLLKIYDNSLCLSVEDDGKGFVPNIHRMEKKFGILGMKERVYALGGNFEITSGLGVGTKIVVALPLITAGFKINT